MVCSYAIEFWRLILKTDSIKDNEIVRSFLPKLFDILRLKLLKVHCIIHVQCIIGKHRITTCISACTCRLCRVQCYSMRTAHTVHALMKYETRLKYSYATKYKEIHFDK